MSFFVISKFRAFVIGFIFLFFILSSVFSFFDEVKTI